MKTRTRIPDSQRPVAPESPEHRLRRLEEAKTKLKETEAQVLEEINNAQGKLKVIQKQLS